MLRLVGSAPVARASSPAAGTETAKPVAPVARVERDQPTINPAVREFRRKAAALVAGRVDADPIRTLDAEAVAARPAGRVSADPSAPYARASIAMYAQPGERNAAATGVNAGRIIDVIG